MTDLVKGGMPIGTVKTWGQGKQWIKTAEGWVPYEGENKGIKEKTEAENKSKQLKFIRGVVENEADRFVNNKVHLNQFKELTIKSLTVFKESVLKDKTKFSPEDTSDLVDFIDKQITKVKAVETHSASHYFQEEWDRRKANALKNNAEYQKNNVAVQNIAKMREDTTNHIKKSFK